MVLASGNLLACLLLFLAGASLDVDPANADPGSPAALIPTGGFGRTTAGEPPGKGPRGLAASAAPAASASSVPCTASATCTSTNPTLYLLYGSSGDTSACTFSFVISWGDGSGQQPATVHGGPPGAYIVAQHTFAAAGTYAVAVSASVSGPCTVSNSNGQFTLVEGGPSKSEGGGPPNRGQSMDICSRGDPVNCATGVLWHTFTDVSIPGHGVPLELSRTYSSASANTAGSLGFGWTSSYDMRLTLDSNSNATIAQENGATLTFFFGGGQYVPGPGALGSLVKNIDGTFAFTRFDDNREFVFNASGKLIKERDRNGFSTNLTYDGGGRLEKVTDPGGRSLTFAYEGAHLRSMTDPMGRATEYAYDGNGNLASSVDSLGRTWAFAYDGNHRLLAITDPNGGTTTSTYDSSGRVTKQVDPLDHTTLWSYSGDPTTAGGGTTTITDPRGVVTEEEYANLKLKSLNAAAGTPRSATTSYDYDLATYRPTVITDPNGKVTTNAYNSRGELTSSKNALGDVVQFTYDESGDMTSVTDPRGTTTEYTYDSAGNLLEEETPDAASGDTVKVTYSHEAAAGDVTGITDGDGHKSSFEYDAFGNLSRASDPLGESTTFSHDLNGHLTGAVLPAGNEPGGDAAAHTVSFGYDEVGQPTSITDQLGHETTYAYDANGNRTRLTAADGHETKYVYDAGDELIETGRADGTALRNEYDAAGNRVSQIDGAGNETAYAYDELNRPVSMTTPTGRVTSFFYDPAGHLIGSVDPAGRHASYAYDDVGQLIEVDFSDPSTATVTQEFDADGNRIGITDGSGTTRLAYDSLNRLIETTDGSGATVGYSYDRSGNIKKIAYPNGQEVSREFDAAGRLTGVTDWLGNTTNLKYDADSNLLAELFPNGVETDLGYDDADALSSVSHNLGPQALASFAYGRDPVGRLDEEDSLNDPSTTISYAHDAVGRLSAAGPVHYGYDAADNLTDIGPDVVQKFSSAGELLSRTGPGEVPSKGGLPSAGGETPPAAQSDTGGSGAGVRAVAAARRPKHGALTSKPIHAEPGDLLVAFVSAAGAKQRVRSVAGGPAWTRVAAIGGAGGRSEVWQARAEKSFDGKVSFRLALKSGLATGSVVSFGGAAQVVAHATQAGSRSAAVNRLQASVGSLFWATGHSVGSRSPQGQGVVSKYFDGHARLAGWVQGNASGSAPTPPGGRSAQWALIGVAIAAAPSTTTSPTSVGSTKSKNDEPPSSPVAGTRHFSYDAAGDRVAEELPDGSTRSFSYDQAGRLTGLGTAISYAYDGDGLRVSKSVEGNVTQFVWGHGGTVPELLQDGSVYYVYGADGRPIEQIEGGAATFLHGDQLGSTRLLTSEAGDVVGRYAYDPWGSVVSHTGQAITHLQFQGQYTDPESGFQYLRARYYDPTTGQFLSPDPISPLTSSRFNYADNNPVDYRDPLGLVTDSQLDSLHDFVGNVAFVTGGVGLVVTAAAASPAVAATFLGVAAFATGEAVSIGAARAWNCWRSHGSNCVQKSVDFVFDLGSASPLKVLRGISAAWDVLKDLKAFTSSPKGCPPPPYPYPGPAFVDPWAGAVGAAR